MNKIGPYTVLRIIGKGGMGTVYEAVNETIAHKVAIKILSPDCIRQPALLKRFFHEARATNLIDDPGIVKVSDMGQTEDGCPYIVMELVKGETLRQRLHAQPLPPHFPISLRLLSQLASTLTASHHARIIHRDLKPDNIMIVPDSAVPGGERIKVLDFGIAKLMEGGGMQTSQSLVMGTPCYMSPEQCRGAGELDAKTDVYSFGVVMYELLCGRPPFEAEAAGDYLVLHMTKDPPPIGRLMPELPLEVTDLVHRLLRKDRTLRPEMAQVAQDLSLLAEKWPLASRARARLSSSVETMETIPPTVVPQLENPRSQQISHRVTYVRRVVLYVSCLVALGFLVRYSVRQRRTPSKMSADVTAQQTSIRSLPSRQTKVADAPRDTTAEAFLPVPTSKLAQQRVNPPVSSEKRSTPQPVRPTSERLTVDVRPITKVQSTPTRLTARRNAAPSPPMVLKKELNTNEKKSQTENIYLD